MLDVHPPHERMHGVRDFLLHLFTITVGLLIALWLEGCAERWHHREVRKEADANLLQEIRDNRVEIDSMRKEIESEKQNLVIVHRFLEARQENKSYDPHGIQLGFSLGQLSDASWRTASATGALSYMEYAHVQRYASVYQLQDKFEGLQAQTFNDFLQLQSYVIYGFNPDKMTAEEAKGAEVELRRVLVHLVALNQLGEAVGKNYETVLDQNQ